jgi:peptidoglycan/xylan/chitin deacetylase (PgdA/CDA1 family)
MNWQTLEIPLDLRPEWLGDRLPRIPVPDGVRPIVSQGGGELQWNFDVDASIEALKSESYAPPQASFTDWLPFPYMNLPAALRLAAARLVFLPKKLRRATSDPFWPTVSAMDVLLQLTERLPKPDWDGKAWAAAITFDVDTVAGLRRCPRIAAAVEQAGFRACFYIVGEVIQSEPELVKELADRGHEIGSHDVAHDNRICFLPPGEMNTRLNQARDIITPYGGTGFRSPSLYRSAEMRRLVLQSFDYDSSLCDTDLEYNRGCGTVFPYRYETGLTIPITLPMDSSLLYTGHSPEKMCQVWRDKCRYIRSLGGLAVLVCHGEPHLSGGEKLEYAYLAFMSWLSSCDDVAVYLPEEIASRRWE